MEATATLNRICQEVGVCESMPSNHELLLHFGIEEAGSPAIILDEATARATPCSCFTYKGKDLCWSRGAIGLLKQEQLDIYCVYL